MNVRRCKFFRMDRPTGNPVNWDMAEDGWFMGIFQDGESPVAIVESFHGPMYKTFVENVCFQRTQIDVLMEVILEEAERTTVKTKWPEMQKFIREQFTKYAFM